MRATCVPDLFLSAHRSTRQFSLLSLHDALPISRRGRERRSARRSETPPGSACGELQLHQAELSTGLGDIVVERSEEHTSELQSLRHLVCRLLLEKKNKKSNMLTYPVASGSPAPR